MSKALVATRDEHTLELLRASLWDRGLHEVVLLTQEEAYGRFPAEDYDLLILDTGLDETGHSLLWTFRGMGLPMPVLVVCATPDHEGEAMALGAQGCLSKPLTPQSLSEALDRCLQPLELLATA